MSDVIYYFPIDGEGNEKEPVALRLQADGSVDLSALPQEIQETLLKLGVPDRAHLSSVYPKEGKTFLDALLALGNPYMRFRSSSEKVTV